MIDIFLTESGTLIQSNDQTGRTGTDWGSSSDHFAFAYAIVSSLLHRFFTASASPVQTRSAHPAEEKKANQKMADELDELMDDFGRKPTITKRLLYMFLALQSVGVTAFLFINVFLVDITASQVTLLLAVILNTLLLSLAYHNLSFAKAARIRRAATPPTKGSFKGNVADYKAALQAFENKIASAALWHSCAYNNAIFMIVTPLLGVYLLSDKFSGELNLLVSGSAAAALAIFNSNTALKAIGEAQ